MELEIIAQDIEKSAQATSNFTAEHAGQHQVVLKKSNLLEELVVVVQNSKGVRDYTYDPTFIGSLQSRSRT